jgi:hypothetical protein
MPWLADWAEESHHVLNEIEEAIVAVLADADSGLPSGAGQPWHVAAARIGRLPPDLQGSLSGKLPAVAFAVVQFTVGEDGYAGVGEVEADGEGLAEIQTLRFDLLYHLDVWATDLDQAQAIVQKAVEVLLQAREGLAVEGDDYRLLALRPLAGRALPAEEAGSSTVFRRQLDVQIESELLIKTHPTAIREVIVEKVEWEIHEE